MRRFMPFLMLLLAFMTLVTITLQAAPCPSSSQWPHLTEWTCSLDAKLSLDDGGSFSRRAQFLSTKDEIQLVRRQTVQDGDEVCQTFPIGAPSQALSAIITTLGLGHWEPPLVTQAAITEIRQSTLAETFDLCASVALDDHDEEQPIYRQAFYFRVGSLRSQRNGLLLVETRW